MLLKFKSVSIEAINFFLQFNHNLGFQSLDYLKTKTKTKISSKIKTKQKKQKTKSILNAKQKKISLQKIYRQVYFIFYCKSQKK